MLKALLYNYTLFTCRYTGKRGSCYFLFSGKSFLIISPINKRVKPVAIIVLLMVLRRLMAILE
jgi:hypothetical protein